MIKKYWVLIFAFTCFQVEGQTRERIIFNRDWKFILGDHPGAERPDYADKDWGRVGLPHSFSIPYFASPEFYTGYGWYRKHFVVDPADIKRKLYLEFEAAFQDAEVFVNGVKVGGHQGGYTGFSLDISSVVKAGDNVVAVRVNNLWNARLAPRAGEHVFSGGIYRDVYLVKKDFVHVTWCGSFVTTPMVSASAARIKVQTEVENAGARSGGVQLRTSILDAGGKVVQEFGTSGELGAIGTRSIEQEGPVLRRPHLWSPDHPYLYRAVTSVYMDGKKRDEYTTRFGIRWIRWTADSGFFLNGKHLYIYGVNVHQDHAGWGDAVTNAGMYRDIALMKAAGFNYIRATTYPHDPAFYEACDSLGMLCWTENTFWGIGGFENAPEGYWSGSSYPTVAADQRPFEESAERQLREMIRIERNHPCVIAWSMSNEPFFSTHQTMSKVRALLRNLVSISHDCDPTRPAAIGGAQRPLDSNRIDLIGDIIGYNGDGASISLFQNPGKPSMVTEYGSVAATRPGNYDPGWGDLSADSGKEVHLWRAGQSIWCGIDHGSIAGPQLGKMGLVDYFRIPKRAWYWYRNCYKHIAPPEWPQPGMPAALRVTADKKQAKTDGTDDIQLTVTVEDATGKPISNSPPVTMDVISGPGEFPTGAAIQFVQGSDIPIDDGQAAIECRSWYAGPCLIRATSPGLRPAEIVLNFEGPVAYKEGTTPKVVSRPYVRFSRAHQDTALQVLGLNNPCFASSADNGHSTGLASDGDTSSCWRPRPEDSVAWWQVNLEKRVEIFGINIRFGAVGRSRYIVEIRDNDHHRWTTVEDNRINGATTSLHSIPVSGVIGEAVRIRFSDASDVRLSEVEVMGRLAP